MTRRHPRRRKGGVSHQTATAETLRDEIPFPEALGHLNPVESITCSDDKGLYQFEEQSSVQAVEPEVIPTPPRLVLRDDARKIWLYYGNCLELLDAIANKYPEGRFDCIFTDPPYFLSNGGITCHAGRMVKVDKGEWDKSKGADENHNFNFEWLSRCQRVLKPNGTIWVTGTHHVIFSIGFAMQQLGFKILNDITWEKPNPPPNLSCRYFTHSTETILWAAKNEKSKHTFNYHLMRQQNGGKQMKTVWRKDQFSSQAEELGSIWTLPAPPASEKVHGKHPTQKPVALVERCLLASTNEGDLILDPFLGSGTTAAACLRLRRGCVGIELSKAHSNLAVKRIESEIRNMAGNLFEH